jgi:hypothetical protein
MVTVQWRVARKRVVIGELLFDFQQSPIDTLGLHLQLMGLPAQVLILFDQGLLVHDKTRLPPAKPRGGRHGSYSRGRRNSPSHVSFMASEHAADHAAQRVSAKAMM